MNGIPSSKRGPGCRLFAISTDPAEMARHYVLSSDDLAVIRTKRRPIADGRRPVLATVVGQKSLTYIKHREQRCGANLGEKPEIRQ
jgi:hypothetical protein